MEKLDNSNQKARTKEFKEKYNNITLFLTKFLFKENFILLKKSGFVNSYISDPSIAQFSSVIGEKRLLFMLFKNKKFNTADLSNIVVNLAKFPTVAYITYELVNDYSMIVLEFPEEYGYDYDLCVNGRYSSLSEDFKSHFPMSQDALNSNKEVLGKEYTLYHHIFNKTEWLGDFWKERLGLFALDQKLELWEQPNEADKVFNLKTIF